MVDADRFRYRALRAKGREAGVFDRRPFAYGVWILVNVGLLAVGYRGLLAHAEGWYRVACIVLCGMTAIQGGFIAHDAGHFAMTSNARLIRLIGLLSMTLPGGQAFAHWKWKHNLHHTKPNTPGHDQDINVFLFAIHEHALAEKGAFTRFTTANQSWLMFLFGPLQITAIRWESLVFVLKNLKTAKLDALFLVLHVILWLVVPGVLCGPLFAITTYVAIALVMGFYGNCVFWWNHIGTRTIADGEELEFAELQVVTSRNLKVTWFGHFLTGGLAAQIEHHLFPTAPMMNLHRVRSLVKDHCADVGLSYVELTFPEAVIGVWRDLRRVAGKLSQGPSQIEPTAENAGS